MTDITKIINGFKIFKNTTYPKFKDIIHHLIEQGQKPSTMIITSSEIRISPAEIFSCNPGELFVLSNLGGIVPNQDFKGVSGIISAIEYAVNILQVSNIIILGHAKCNALNMVISDKYQSKQLSESMGNWFNIVTEAREAVKKQLGSKTPEEQQISFEQETLILSLRNLLEYSFIAKKVSEKKLTVNAWQFNIENGEIMAFDGNTGYFEPIS
jgi:carbonic anhydrase